MARSSIDEHPCPSVDGEFWQSQNIAFIYAPAIRGGAERRVCVSANVDN